MKRIRTWFVGTTSRQRWLLAICALVVVVVVYGGYRIFSGGETAEEKADRVARVVTLQALIAEGKDVVTLFNRVAADLEATEQLMSGAAEVNGQIGMGAMAGSYLPNADEVKKIASDFAADFWGRAQKVWGGNQSGEATIEEDSCTDNNRRKANQTVLKGLNAVLTTFNQHCGEPTYSFSCHNDAVYSSMSACVAKWRADGIDLEPFRSANRQTKNNAKAIAAAINKQLEAWRQELEKKED